MVFGSGPAAAIEDLIAAVEAADLQPRIEKILTKTLGRALDNLNKGKESRAIIALRLFIIEVKALRGKKIDEADADAWIADARAIIDTLKAERPTPEAAPSRPEPDGRSAGVSCHGQPRWRRRHSPLPKWQGFPELAQGRAAAAETDAGRRCPGSPSRAALYRGCRRSATRAAELTS